MSRCGHSTDNEAVGLKKVAIADGFPREAAGEKGCKGKAVGVLVFFQCVAIWSDCGGERPKSCVGRVVYRKIPWLVVNIFDESDDASDLRAGNKLLDWALLFTSSFLALPPPLLFPDLPAPPVFFLLCRRRRCKGSRRKRSGRRTTWCALDIAGHVCLRIVGAEQCFPSGASKGGCYCCGARDCCDIDIDRSKRQKHRR